MLYTAHNVGGNTMRNVDIEEDYREEVEEDVRLSEEELLEDDEISDIEEAFIRGYEHA